MKTILTLLLASASLASALSLTFDPPPAGAFVIDFETPGPLLGVIWEEENVFSNSELPYIAKPSPLGSGKFLASNQLGEISGSTTITFAGPVDFIGFNLGSPDNYNRVELFRGGVSQGFFTGAQVPPSSGARNVSPFVGISGGLFDQMVISSSRYNAELDNLTYTTPERIQLPEPSVPLLALGALSAGFLLRRRR